MRPETPGDVLRGHDPLPDQRIDHALFAVETGAGRVDLFVRAAKALKGEQVPQYFKGRDAQDFVLARP